MPLSLLLRRLRYRLATLIETLATLSGFGVGAVLALRLRDAEALVLGQVTTSGALCAMSVLAARSELGIAFSRAEARRLFSFSAQVSAQSLTHYLNGALPTFSVSRWLGATSLGFYSRGSVLVGLPWNFMIQGIYKTIYPLYPRYREDRAGCQRMMVDVTSVTTALSWPLFGALAGLAPLIVELLLGSEWEPVSGVVPALSLSAAVGVSYTIFISMSQAFGFLGQVWILQIAWMVVLISALAVTIYAGGGIKTIALVAAFVGVAIHLLQLAMIVPTRLIDLGGTLRAEGAAAFVGGVWYAITALATGMTEQASLAHRILASGTAVVTLALLTYLALPYLPAGRAFARHGIVLFLHSRHSSNPSGKSRRRPTNCLAGWLRLTPHLENPRSRMPSPGTGELIRPPAVTRRRNYCRSAAATQRCPAGCECGRC